MNTPTCPRCGEPVAADNPQELCPRCLLEQGMDEPELFHTRGEEPLRPPPSPEEIQPLFPHLEIVRLIGRGGMGAVYEALQRGLQRRVALKLLWAPDHPDAGFEQRFAREGRALAQLAHPNVVAVHDAGKSGPYYWLIMEYVDGPNLRGLLQGGPIEAPRALALVMQMCAALHYAHRRGVVHRDIKPENVLLARNGRVKIADFGLAKMLARNPRSAALTGSEQAMGTPHYIAPEQIEHPKDVDHRADIYSLGVVLYEVLTGELPIGRFQMPSRKAAVDTRMDEIVVKALQKQPERRYQSVAEVSTAIKNVSEGRGPVRARTARATSTRPAPWVLLAAAGAVLLGGWLVASRLGGVSAAPKTVLAPDESMAQGRQLIQFPETLRKGIDCLEAAYAVAPDHPGLTSLLEKALWQDARALLKAGESDQAVLRAQRIQEIAPAPKNEPELAQMRQVARDQWQQIIQIREPKENEVLGTGALQVRGDVGIQGAGARLAIDGVTVEVVGGEFEHTLGSRSDGEHTITLAIATPSGLSVPLERHFRIDTKKPEITVETPAPGAFARGSFTVSGRVVDTTETTVTARGQVAHVQDGAWTLELSLPEGPEEVVLVAKDALGHTNQTVLAVVVDVHPPRIEASERGTELAYSLRDDGILLRILDDRRLAKVTWNDKVLLFDASGLVKIPTDGLQAEGVPVSHVLRAEDEAGNPATWNYVLRRDETPPLVSIGPEVHDVFPASTYILEGTFADQSACRIVVDGEQSILSDGKVRVPVAIAADRRPLDVIHLAFEVLDEANNKKAGTKTLRVVAPCESCVQVDELRGKCTTCKGLGEEEKDCRNRGCQDGQALELCGDCGGTKKAQCGVCAGNGYSASIACLECEAGRVTCGTCDGSGTVTVDCRNPNCNGGWVYHVGLPAGRKSRCNYCEGDTKQEVQCKTCDGKLRVACSQCRNGVVQPACQHCQGGRTDEPCGVCSGSGKVRRECTACGGGGRKTGPCLTCKGSGACLICGGKGRADAAIGAIDAAPAPSRDGPR